MAKERFLPAGLLAVVFYWGCQSTVEEFDGTNHVYVAMLAFGGIVVFLNIARRVWRGRLENSDA